jgi:hypothetical protein
VKVSTSPSPVQGSGIAIHARSLQGIGYEPGAAVNRPDDVVPLLQGTLASSPLETGGFFCGADHQQGTSAGCPAVHREDLVLGGGRLQGVALVRGGRHSNFASPGAIHRVVAGGVAVQGYGLDRGTRGEGVTDGQVMVQHLQ